MDTIDLISQLTGTKADLTAITLSAKWYGWTEKISVTQPVLDENGNPTFIDNLVQFPITETVEIDNPQSANEFLEKKFATEFKEGFDNQRKKEARAEVDRQLKIVEERLISESEVLGSDINNDIIIEKNA